MCRSFLTLLISAERSVSVVRQDLQADPMMQTILSVLRYSQAGLPASRRKFSRAVKFRVNAGARDQFRTTAFFNDPSMVEHDDLIQVMNCRQAMCCDQSCPAAH